MLLSNGHASARADLLPGFRGQFEADCLFGGAAPAMFPEGDPPAPAALATRDSRETNGRRAAASRNEVTPRGVEMLSEYEPGAYLRWISPTLLLLCVADEDGLRPSELAIEMYERGREPERLVLPPGGRFDAYMDVFEISSAAATDWFSHHLLTREPIAV